MLIIDATPQGKGWYPINHMVNLASRLLSAKLQVVPAGQRPSLATRVQSIIRRRIIDHDSNETCLIVCASPTDLLQLLQIQRWRSRFRFVAAWVIDSFWLEWIPATIRWSMPFDHIFITSGEDIDGWFRATGIRPTWLPWGTDALRLGSDCAERPWDITRVGRQPPEWEDDAASAAVATNLGMRFHPRPEENEFITPLANYQALMSVYAATKYMIAFSNRVNPTNYTHPTREYLTGRWADALAGGAIVAGCAPRGDCIDTLLWPGATLDLGNTSRGFGIRLIADARSDWTPAKARLNFAMSLERLDWRHRFSVISTVAGEEARNLELEMHSLHAMQASLGKSNCDSLPS